MDDIDVGPAWIALLVSGIINTLYGLGYFGWSMFSLLFGGLAALGQINAILDGHLQMSGILFALVAALTPVLQVLAYGVIGIMGLVTIFGAVRLRTASSKGIVMLGIVCAIGAPVIGFAFTSLSLCNVGNCGACVFGFMFGNIGTIPAFVAGIIGSGWALATIRDPAVAEAFAS